MTTADIAVNLTEFEASILLGGLLDAARRWEDDARQEEDAPMAYALYDAIAAQLPEKWNYKPVSR
jgi:hypothetical protein